MTLVQGGKTQLSAALNPIINDLKRVISKLSLALSLVKAQIKRIIMLSLLALCAIFIIDKASNI